MATAVDKLLSCFRLYDGKQRKFAALLYDWLGDGKIDACLQLVGEMDIHALTF